jgi:branched-chain amino acid transport system substrate-binding protein
LGSLATALLKSSLIDLQREILMKKQVDRPTKYGKLFRSALWTLIYGGTAFGGLIGTSSFAQQQGVTDTEIVLGDILPLTGPPALLGVAHNIGVKVAVAEVNAAGGINGRKIRLISEDDGYVVSRTLQGVRKLVTVDKVFALTSLSGSAQGQAALPLIKEFGLPVISTISFSDDIVSPITKNVFAFGTTHPLVAGTLTDMMASRYPGKKWAVVTQDDEYGELSREGFEATVKSKKLNVVSTAIYKKGQVDFSSEMLKAKEAGAEILYAGGVIGENVAMAKELERLGHKIPIGVSFVSRVPVALRLMGSAGDNVHVMDYVVSEESPQGKAFLDKAKALVSEEDFKRVNRFTFTGYAGARTLFEAMRRCGKALTWSCTITQMESLNKFETTVLTSPVSFSPQSHLSLQKLVMLKANSASQSFRPLE